MLWTRITPPAGHQADIPVQWELASDAAFASIVARGESSATAARDFTVKVDAAGLKPATVYHFRFRAHGVTSAAARTRTLPTGSVAQVRLAVFSCANYPAGYFNVYADAARRSDLDATVHLGDYIYEYARGGYASAQAEAMGRLVNPAGEILSLADYRERHAQYKSDADLQALHAAAPMIAIWDDHEFANDTWSAGAENHQPGEGDFAMRKAAAMQAYHEWMPTRTASAELIYRSFDFGDLVSLHMLDTRVIGRDKQLDYADFMTSAGIDSAGFTTAMANPSRQLLGQTQTQWLQQQMAASRATWQVLGQQVLMGRMNIPAPYSWKPSKPVRAYRSRSTQRWLPRRRPRPPRSRLRSRPSWPSPRSPTTWTPGMATRPRARPFWAPRVSSARSWWCWPATRTTPGPASCRT
jgi:alkaline phosphatase D